MPKINQNALRRAAAQITSDLDSSRRHWQEVLDATKARAPFASGRRGELNAWEGRVAQAALAAIQAGYAPSLVLGEAAAELAVAKVTS